MSLEAVSPFISAAAGAVLTSSMVAVIFSAWLRSRTARLDRLTNKVKDLEERRMGVLENRLEALEHDGCGVGLRVLTKLETQTGILVKLDGKLDRIAEDTAAQAAKIEANAHYIGNLDASFARHKDGPQHNG